MMFLTNNRKDHFEIYTKVFRYSKKYIYKGLEQFEGTDAEEIVRIKHFFI